MSGLCIRGTAIEPPLLLAPMAELTDPPFRRLVSRLGGAGAMVTPMFTPASARAHQAGRLPVGTGMPGAPPLLIQIAPASTADVEDSLPRLLSLCAPAGIDINMGCAAPRIRRTGAGAALAREPDRAARVVERARRLCGSLPLSVKLRAGDAPVGGLDEGSPPFLACAERLASLARALVDAGADALVLHPRGTTEGFRRRAAWGLIPLLARSVRVPVIGSGDVLSPASAMARLALPGCAGVMLGRGALRDPWLPAAVSATLEGRPFDPPSAAERGAGILALLDDIAATYDAGRARARIALIAPYVLDPFPFGRRAALALRLLPDPASQRDSAARFLEAAATPAARHVVD